MRQIILLLKSEFIFKISTSYSVIFKVLLINRLEDVSFSLLMDGHLSKLKGAIVTLVELGRALLSKVMNTTAQFTINNLILHELVRTNIIQFRLYRNCLIFFVLHSAGEELLYGLFLIIII